MLLGTLGKSNKCSVQLKFIDRHQPSLGYGKSLIPEYDKKLLTVNYQM